MKFRRILSHGSVAAGFLALMLGLVVIYGWHTRALTLIQVLPTFVPMQYNTALGFVLCGASLLLICFGRPKWAVWTGGLATAVGGLTLLEYIMNVNFGIDELFMKHDITVETSQPGRMAPNTAVCFTLIGLATAVRLTRHLSLFRVILASLALGLGVVALSGYAAELETAYGWGNLTRMAVHTSVGFIVVSAGFLMRAWHQDLDEDSVLPRWMPVPTCIAILTATICLWQALNAGNQRILDEYGQVSSISNVATMLLIVGSLLAVAMAAAAGFAQTAGERARAIARTNEALQAVARELANAENRKHAEALLGQSIPVRALREGIERYGDTDEPLLLTGPTGAGQEAVARSIHQNSPRSDRPFIYVACAHLADQGDSVFGLSQGDAHLSQPGKASLADGGTLYLEGIEAMSKEAQLLLCSTLQDAADSRAAGTPPVPDIRLIASRSDRGSDTSEDQVEPALERALGRNQLSVPSLAERRDDIVVIAQHILTARATSSGKVLDGLTEEDEQLLQQYSWPGNLRELRSVVERAVLLASGSKVEIPPELLREGRRVGGYTLQKQIGRGGMGEVWLAQHALLARPSAVKLIRQRALWGDTASREMLRERFQREAKATAKLRSPHTVELYDFGISDDGDFYYVMEYLKGIDLHRLVGEYGALPPARAIHLLQQACLSLDEAHRAGLVHRDVKPANLFVCELGTQYDFLKLLDFGIVRSTGNADQTADRTEGSTGMIKGTPACISPEAANGEQATSASDVYSLGCVAFKLLTGSDVFVAKGIMPLLVKHISEQPQPPSHYNPDLPEGLDELVLSCLAKDPDQRPTAKEVRERLGAIPLDETWNNELATCWWADHTLVLEALDEEKQPEPETDFTESTSQFPGDHPTEQDLRRWIGGELSLRGTTAVEQHVEVCDACAEKVGRLSSQDEFVDHVRNVMSSSDDGESTVNDKHNQATHVAKSKNRNGSENRP